MNHIASARRLVMSQVYALLGRPSTEVATFARLISARLRAAEVISIPAVVAAEVSHRTHLGTQLSSHAAKEEAGSWLPSALVAPLVQARLQRAQQAGGVMVLSGFPRTRDQLQMLQQAGVPSPHVLHLARARDDAERHIADRRICAACGEPMYPLPAVDGAPAGLHSHFVETDCDADTPLRAAIDDAGALQRRLDAYDTHTVPLLERLRVGGAASFHELAVGDSAEDTWAAIQAAIGLPPDAPGNSQ